MGIEEIEKLENQLMLMGMSAMAYTPEWNMVAKKLKELRSHLGVKT